MEFVSYDIDSMDFRQAGSASRALKERLKLIGADAEAVRRAMIAAYEAEMNVVIHSVGGRLEASLSDSQVDVNVVDTGPGIPDLDKAMVEGFSTASAEARALGFGAGMGLPNIKKNSDRLRLTSRVGEGTRVSFTIYLRPGRTDGFHSLSLYATAELCRDCRACLAACPTRAMRVREGRPSVLEHLCIDCTECIRACPFGALGIREDYTSLDDLQHKEKMLLVVPPALLAGCGPDYPPATVLAALGELGFAEVVTTESVEEALRATTATWAGRQASETAAMPKPVITPACPAAVDLVQLRFPSLVPHLAPFDSPWEAAHGAQAGRPTAYVVSCPSQRSALLAHGAGTPAGGRGAAAGDGRDDSPGGDAAPSDEYLTPEVVREAVLAKLARGGKHVTAPAGPVSVWPDAGSATLVVTGPAHVMAVLEELEDGLLDDVAAIEPYMCEGGCFGSPLLPEDHHVAARRWIQGRATATSAAAVAAAPRRRPYAARPGIRLDADMAKAIEKLGRLQTVIDSLPGKDCGACGAPTCAALAEDVVMERATVGLCPYFKPSKKEDGA